MSVYLFVPLSLSVVQVIGTYLKHFLCQSQICRNCRSKPGTQRLLQFVSLSSWCPDSWLVLEDHPCIMYIGTSIWSSMYCATACSVLAAKHPLLFAGVHWTSLAAGRTTSPQALGWTAIPWQQGSTLDYPCQRGSSSICIPDIAGDNPCDIGPFPPMDIGFQCWGDNPWWCCAPRVGKVSSCC